MKTNVYGPRPRDCGFRCISCGSQEYPLFGFTPTSHNRPDSNTNTVCPSCLNSGILRANRYEPTPDARRALEAAGHPEFTQ